MRIIIEETLNDLLPYLGQQMVINIEEINDSNIDRLLDADELVVIGVGRENSILVSHMINSRQNDAKVITLVQQHPNLLVLLDKEGAQKIYE
ncbi:MAG TPA: hypothetical protein GX703_06850 [Erysipelothrix sp.]|jgi:hypothetical protein|nr:hypothetical protein [Erysipelothrix sp.]